MNEIQYEKWRIDDTVAYIVDHKFTSVTCQFPDDMLHDACDVANALKKACIAKQHDAQIYVLADTTYNSVSVDEVAAAHVSGQCVIHYGRASLSKVSRVPAFFVFPEEDLDIELATQAIAAHFSSKAQHKTDNGDDTKKSLVVFVDQPHIYRLQELQQQLNTRLTQADIVYADVAARELHPVGLNAACCETQRGACCNAIDTSEPIPESKDTSIEDVDDVLVFNEAGYTWQLSHRNNSDGNIKKHDAAITSCRYLWIGDPAAPALSQLQLTYNGASWLMYDSKSNALVEGISSELARLLRRRYFLVEKARNAAIIGILVGTLGVAGYQQVVDDLQQAARAAGKKTYTLLMGKPNPAKLANFPEVEVFVLVSDAQGQILDSKEYLAPIITPQEAMIAFSRGLEWDAANYRVDFEGLLSILNNKEDDATANRASPTTDEPRFSLIDSSYHTVDTYEFQGGHDGGVENGESTQATTTTSALALHAQHALSITPVDEHSKHLVQARSAAEYYINKRDWKGVEAPVVGAETKAVVDVEEGRSGRAAGYVDEPPT